MKIGVLVLDGVFDLGLSSVLDTFGIASMLSTGPRFDLKLLGVRDEVHTSHGLSIPVADASKSGVDLILLPANGCTQPDTLGSRLLRDDTKEAAEQLRGWRDGGTEIAAACTGTYFLAHAGVLDGAPATTSWWLSADFRRRFPSVWGRGWLFSCVRGTRHQCSACSALPM